MKKTILCAIVALVTAIVPAVAGAVDMKHVGSKVSGFSCQVPSTATVMSDNKEGVTYFTPDNHFMLSAMPVEGDRLTNDVINTVITALADAADLNFEKCDTVDFKNDTMEGVIYIQTKGNSQKVAVGLVGVKEGNQGYFITTIAQNDCLEAFDAVLNSITYDGSIVETKKAAAKKGATKQGSGHKHRR